MCVTPRSLCSRWAKWKIVIHWPQKEPRVSCEYPNDHIGTPVQGHRLANDLRIASEDSAPEPFGHYDCRRGPCCLIAGTKQPAHQRTGSGQLKEFVRDQAGVRQHCLTTACE